MTGPRCRRPHPTLPDAATRRRIAGGFTLVELMVSIALALLLILGINAVFKMSSDTVGSGMQMAQMMRQFRTANTALGNDLDPTHFASSTQHPALIIESYNQPAFRDRNDELAAINVPSGYDPTATDIDVAQAAALNVRDADGNPLYPSLAGWSGIPTYVAFPQVINNRNHRVDVLSFFIRNPNGMQRQTPNYPNAVMDTTANGATLTPEYQGHYKSTQAWVVYGHVLQPDNTVNAENMLQFNPNGAGGQTHFLGLGLTRDPYTGALYTSGATPVPTNNQVNPNNFYSSQWVLGRTSVLMGEPADLDSYANPYTNNSVTAPALEPQTYAKDPAVNKAAGYTQPVDAPEVEALRPLSWGATIWGTNNGNPQALAAQNAPAAIGNTGGIQIQTSQADVAGISLQTMHDKALAAENPPTAPATYLPQWYLPLLAMGYGQPPEQQNPQLPGLTPAGGSWVWPANLAPTKPFGYGPWHTYRFMAQAWPDKLAANGSPMVSQAIAAMHQQMAVQTPIFLRGCSQFIVEYAGDYLQQAPTTAGGVPAGTITGIGEDGQIDFDAVTDPTTRDASGNFTTIKRIRWYGMTRSLDDGSSVEDTTQPMVVTPTGTNGAPPKNSQIVRPLYRYIQQFTGGAAGTLTHMPFEKINAAGPTSGGPWYTGFPDNKPANVDSYTCAWGPLEMNLDQVTVQYLNDTGGWANLYGLVQPLTTTQFPSRSLLPWMIRVTIRLDDPSGRMPDGQTMQFIYTIPRPH